jgi:hypothetical protein
VKLPSDPQRVVGYLASVQLSKAIGKPRENVPNSDIRWENVPIYLGVMKYLK